MIRAAFEKLGKWWSETAWPWIRSTTIELADEWWNDIGEKPRPHFVSMVAGIFIYLAFKIALTFAL